MNYYNELKLDSKKCKVYQLIFIRVNFLSTTVISNYIIIGFGTFFLGFLGKENVHRIDAFATKISNPVGDIFFGDENEKCQPKRK